MSSNYHARCFICRAIYNLNIYMPPARISKYTAPRRGVESRRVSAPDEYGRRTWRPAWRGWRRAALLVSCICRARVCLRVQGRCRCPRWRADERQAAAGSCTWTEFLESRLEKRLVVCLGEIGRNVRTPRSDRAAANQVSTRPGPLHRRAGSRRRDVLHQSFPLWFDTVLFSPCLTTRL